MGCGIVGHEVGKSLFDEQAPQILVLSEWLDRWGRRAMMLSSQVGPSKGTPRRKVKVPHTDRSKRYLTTTAVTQMKAVGGVQHQQ